VEKDKKKDLKVLVENVKVRAIDWQGVPGAVSPVATLELTTNQAQTLAKAFDNGPLTLHLHPPALAPKKGDDSEKPNNTKKGPDKEK
jgi:hypothetical protein